MWLRINVPARDAPPILGGLVHVNLTEMREANALGTTPVLDGLHGGTVRYDRRDPEEHWKDWKTVVRDGKEDCEDLVTADVAEMRGIGWEAEPVAYEPSANLWHVVLRYRRPGGKWAWGDPSVLGGMTGAA